ncbi:PhnD/SsuA/transferrin family substrate-binding protein [Pseudoalteromonas atlantica]|uniref:PhnD/SsuA/transferrin family substrate-binding protein n=1 Tax=Pseudoalteromonas atlantica TaxID=288 RepID=UPI003736BC1D
MKIKQQILSHSTFVTVLLLFFVVLWFVTQSFVATEPKTLKPLIETSSRCFTSASQNKEQLIIYATSQKVAKSIINSLCEDAVVTKQYGEVRGFWGYRTADSIEFVGKGIADLILAKNNIMSAFKAESTYNYQPIVGFPSYTAFFISAKEKPKIEKQYFLDKRIGLLDYPTSRSGHILPKQTFKELGINLENLDVTYASSHSELRELLANGEVDIIASFWKNTDQQSFSKNYITPISSNIIGTRWYLKMQHENTDLLCAIQTNLLALSQSQTSSYFNHVEPYWQCSDSDAVFLGEGDD